MPIAEDGTWVPESFYTAGKGKEQELRDRRAIERLTEELTDLRRQVNRLRRGGRAAQGHRTAVMGGQFLFYDADGNLRTIAGAQADGTITIRDGNAPPPPSPSLPIVTALPGGFTVRWDGGFEGGVARPSDWKRTDVHIDQISAFDPDENTIDAAIIRDDGAKLTVATDDYVPHYVKLVTVNTSGRASVPTAEVEVTPLQLGPGQLGPDSVGTIELEAGAVEPSNSAVGVTGNLAPDPSFNDPAWRTMRTGRLMSQVWGFVDGPSIGLVPRWLATCDASTTPADFQLAPGTTPVIEGEKYYVAYWAAAETGAIGQFRIRPDLFDPDGSQVVLQQGTGDVTIEPYPIQEFPTDGTINLLEGELTIPPGAVSLTLVAERADDSAVGSAGFLYVDKIEVRPIMSKSSTSINQVQTGPSGVVVVNPVGDALGSISSEGSLAATYANVTEGFNYRGIELSDTLDPLPRGLIALGKFDGVSATTTGELGVFEFEFEAQPGRSYRLGVGGFGRQAMEAGATHRSRVRLTLDGSRPTVSSSLYAAFLDGWLHVVRMVPDDAPVRFRILYTIQSTSGAVRANCTDGWVGQQNATFWVEDIGPWRDTIGVPSDGGGTSVPPTSTYRTTWGSTWTRSYNVPDPIRSADGDFWQGFYPDGYNGDNVATIGFFDGGIRNALAGSTINKTEVYLYANHWYHNSGGTVVLGSHNESAPLSTYPPYPRTVNQASWHLNKPEGRWVTVTNTIGNWFRDGLAKGLLVDAMFLGHNYGYYGRFRGQNAGGTRPHLRITYTK